MQLAYFTEDAYEKLKSEIPQNEEKYHSDEEWLSAYFGEGEDYYRVSSVEVGKVDLSFLPGKKDDHQKNEEDLMNTRLLYDAFKNLTPLQASNKYMWAYLCHVNYREYVQDRWMQESRENTIKNRYFAETATNLLNDNALSRLWWYGYLTYDETNRNPYELTSILLLNQTICTDVMDTFNRMSRTRMKGVLHAIRDFNDTLDPGEGITEYFRECKKYLNHYAAVTTMDFLESEEIRELAFNYMVALREERMNETGGLRNKRRKKK